MNTGCLFYPDLTFFSVFKKKCETQTQVRIKKKIMFSLVHKHFF